MIEKKNILGNTGNIYIKILILFLIQLHSYIKILKYFSKNLRELLS